MASSLRTLSTSMILLLCACATTAQRPGAAKSACAGTAEANRQIVLDFYAEGLIGLQPRAAFTRHMSEDFIEHKPDVAGGSREDAAAYLEGLIREVPDPRWEIIRTIAEGDLVFLHARFTPQVGAPPYAIADVFRLKDCKIVEHWDVVAPPASSPRNPNTRF
jgi:predicted SnoaL-like aldol condensation-catalyzing enzyme